MKTIAATAENVREMTLESAIESRLVELLEEEMDELPGDLVIYARHQMDYGQTPSIVCSATIQSDADIPGIWKVDVSSTLTFRPSELTPTEADAVFRRVSALMGQAAPTLQTTLTTAAVHVYGVEYDDPFDRDRDDETETRSFSCMAIAGLLDPS